MIVTVVYLYFAAQGAWELDTDIMLGTAILDLLMASAIFPVVEASG